ncbi:ornithine cyclodeaminase family protein [Niveispirillum sp. KHB5.9]|uniref:ornithine cyclodeaminase family protein n=1 Tax=Niveispirillum sp. KHB5.9 TaxID=3400269 RepID=UPI003A8B5941
MSIIVLDRHAVETLLPMDECIDAVAHGMARTARGGTRQPPRSRLDLPLPGNLLSMMPGWIDEPEAFGIKVVSVFPGNFNVGLPSHRGLVLLFEAVHGALVGIFDGGAITAIRTAAASALATRLLSRPDATRLAVLGYGEQAEQHVAAMLVVRPISHVAVWGRSPDKAADFCRRLSEKHGIDMEPAASVQEAVAKADIICTTTASREPILQGAWVPEGCHLNIVGSSFPQNREIDAETVVRSRFYVDYKPSTLALAGDYQDALARGLIDENHIIGGTGDVLEGLAPGRGDARDITLYKSVGIVAQDLVAAQHLLNKALNDPAARDSGLVQSIRL